jgi:TRAP-type C4-dicarboxylate transport system substrate-binding protein
MLSEHERRIVTEAAHRAIAWNRRMSRQIDEEAIALARSKGVQVLELTERERAQLAVQAQPAVIDWLRGNLDDPSLIDALMEETARQTARLP